MQKPSPVKTTETVSSVPLTIARAEWRTAILFLLSMSVSGLMFYPALIFVIGFILSSWRNDRYNFIIMTALFVGGYGFIDDSVTFIKMQDVMLVVAITLLFLFKKAPIIRQTLTLLCVYGAILIFIATFSRESMAVQLLSIRGYLTFVIFIIPIVAFSGMNFSLKEFSRKLMPFVLTICIFYVLDAFVLSGNLFVPKTYIWGEQISTFYSPYIQPLSFSVFRKYPIGIFILYLAIYPAIHFFKLRPWHWIIIILAMLSTQTFTVTIAIVLTYVIFKGGFKKLLKYTGILILCLISIYYIDGMLPGRDNESHESAMRIKSTVDQFVELTKYVDDEDIAKFGSGRVGQILPKYEVLQRENRQLTGLGFLHTEKTKIKDYVITNEYYTDISNNEEVATGIEVVLMQVFISAGWLGLIAHILFFVILCLMIRRMRYAGLFFSVLCACFISGWGGFAQTYNTYGLVLLALAYSAVILDNRCKLKGFNLPSNKSGKDS